MSRRAAASNNRRTSCTFSRDMARSISARRFPQAARGYGQGMIEENQPEEASADAAPEGASEEGRPDDEALENEDAVSDPDPEQPDPESGAAAGDG